PASRLRSRQYLSDAVGHGGNLPATRRHAQGFRGPLLIGVKRLVETPSLRSALPTRGPGGKRSRSEWSCPALQQGEEHVDVEHRSKTLTGWAVCQPFPAERGRGPGLGACHDRGREGSRQENLLRALRRLSRRAAQGRNRQEPGTPLGKGACRRPHG